VRFYAPRTGHFSKTKLQRLRVRNLGARPNFGTLFCQEVRFPAPPRSRARRPTPRALTARFLTTRSGLPPPAIPPRPCTSPLRARPSASRRLQRRPLSLSASTCPPRPARTRAPMPLPSPLRALGIPTPRPESRLRPPSRQSVPLAPPPRTSAPPSRPPSHSRHPPFPPFPRDSGDSRPGSHSTTRTRVPGQRAARVRAARPDVPLARPSPISRPSRLPPCPHPAAPPRPRAPSDPFLAHSSHPPPRPPPPPRPALALPPPGDARGRKTG